MTKTRTRTIAVASGKGGAGKTSVAICLAWILAEQGSRVCLVDVDLGLSNVDVLLGLSPQWTLEDVILGDTPIDRTIIPVRPGLDVISGGTGVAALADLDRSRRAAFLKKMRSLDYYDFLLLDNSPGIHRQVVAFCLAAREQIIVINPEPASVTDGYALLKVLKQNGLHRPPYILLNRVPSGFEHSVLMERFAAVCKKHIQTFILPLGAVPDDPFFRKAAAQSRAPVALRPQSPGVVALIRATALLAKRSERKALYTDVGEFWNASIVHMFQGLLPPDAKSRTGTSSSGSMGSMHDLVRRLESILAELESLEPRALAQGNAHASGVLVASKRLTGVGERLIRMAEGLERQGQTVAGRNVGILCPDESLRTLLLELVSQKGGRPVTINGFSETPSGLELLVCSLSKSEGGALQALQRLAKIPCLWLSEYKREIPVWARGLHVVEVVEKPFSLEKIYRALDMSFSPRDLSDPTRVSLGKMLAVPESPRMPKGRMIQHDEEGLHGKGDRAERQREE